MTLAEALAEAAARFHQAGCETPALDARALLAALLRRDHAWLIAHREEALPEQLQPKWEAWVARRASREPLAYILGEKEFWSRAFAVTPAVLIPRPETEHLIEAVMEALPDRKAPWRFCDIGTGSGCLAVTLACEYPNARVMATDVSAGALAVAAENARRYDVASRIAFRQGDLFAALDAADGPFDIIVSNPPYVGRQEMSTLAPELAWEPEAALTDGADGLSLLRMLVSDAPDWLRPGGLLVVETGLCGLPEATDRMMLEREIHDLAGRLRGGVFRLAFAKGRAA